MNLCTLAFAVLVVADPRIQSDSSDAAQPQHLTSYAGMLIPNGLESPFMLVTAQDLWFKELEFCGRTVRPHPCLSAMKLSIVQG